MLKSTLLISACLVLFASLFNSCNKAEASMPCQAENVPNDMIVIPSSDPLFVNSIVSTDIDFITATDNDMLENVSFVGLEDKEMPSSLTEELFDQDTYVFNTTYTDGTSVEIWAHSSFGSEAAAQEYVNKLAPRLGKLPNVMRAPLDHVVLHNGDAGAYAESLGHFFMIYSENMDVRISNNDLEETVFHESVHASLDEDHLLSIDWLQAQVVDQNFITEYAQNFPDKEDMAESALFVYTMMTHPGRLSSDIEEWVTTHIPFKKAYIEGIYE